MTNPFETASTDDSMALKKPGKYQFVINKVEVKQSNSTGKSYFNFWLKSIEDGKVIFKMNFATPDYSGNNANWLQKEVNFLARLFLSAGLEQPVTWVKPSDAQKLKDKYVDVQVGIGEDMNGNEINIALETFPGTYKPAPELQEAFDAPPVEAYSDDDNIPWE